MVSQALHVSGVDTHKSVDTLDQHLLYGNLQLEETIQNQQDQDHWLHALGDVVWAPMA